MKKLLAQTALAGMMTMAVTSTASATCVLDSGAYLGCTLSEFTTTFFPANFSSFAPGISSAIGYYYVDDTYFGDWGAVIFKSTSVATSLVTGIEHNWAAGTPSVVTVPFESAGAGLPVLAALAGYLAWRRSRSVSAAA